MALDSDRHDAQPPGLDRAPDAQPFDLRSSRGARILAPTQTGNAHRAALAATTFLDEPTLRSLEDCCLAVHDIALIAPSHAVHQKHEAFLSQLATDVQALAQWVQTALAAFRDSRRATSAHASAQPPATAPSTRLPSPPTTLPASSPAPDDPALRCDKSAPTRTPVPTERTWQPGARQPEPTTTAPPKHIVVRFLSSLRNQRRPHPAHVRDALNKSLGANWVSGIRYSRDDQIILHPHASRTVQQLLERRRTIDDTLRPLLCPDDKTLLSFDAGGTWAKLVIHGAPLPVWDEESTPRKQFLSLIPQLLQSGEIDRDSLRHTRLLCSPDEAERRMRTCGRFSPQYASILFCVQDDDAAARLLRHGIMVQGLHCRVSLFRPRRTNQS
ncbi:hypothetical protein EXIGLDRAFT_828874 [Exidia glandulosa HHB12029]|uniref:Uncharacterized protein n=1 Tax=Exidia glandulosa HHB12029 TaxID=1314781 RepID=A0A165Q628_EXIGL|nr:hypothetical protein EXIGLDRAFT_828874 [Exidia glandulosa HHB12029]